MSEEQHPLRPFLPEGTRIVFLGSFPPQQKRWCMDFFYPNYINDHWRIMGLVFFGNKMHFVDESRRTFRLDAIRQFASSVGIGYYDTATVVRRTRDNASDKFLEVVTPTDIAALVAPLHHLQAIAVTGELAAQTLCNTLHIDAAPAVGSFVEYNLPATDNNERRNQIRIYRLPSSSRAYPLPIEKKAAVYQKMFIDLNIYSR